MLLAVYLIVPDFYSIFHGTRIEAVSDMQEQTKLLPQEPCRFFADSASMLHSPKYSNPTDRAKYPFGQMEYDSAFTFANPLPAVPYVIARGKNRFETFCVPCHGNNGKGLGLVISKPKLDDDEEGFPPPADLTSKHTIMLSDSRLFHILSAGQNLMFPVNNRVSEIDRWALVLYIRELQKK